MKVAVLAGLAASLILTSASAQTDTTRKGTGTRKSDTSQGSRKTTPSTSGQASSRQQSSTSGQAASQQQSRATQKAGTTTKTGKNGSKANSKSGRTSTGAVDSARSSTQDSSQSSTQSSTQSSSQSSTQTSTQNSGTPTIARGTTARDSSGATPPDSASLTDSTRGLPSSVASGAAQTVASGATGSVAAGVTNGTSNTQQGNKVGKMTVTEFNNINSKGTQLVRAIKPSKGSLSTDDQQLFMQVAAGGQRQLAISQAVLEKVSDPQVKILASSEVEEQTTIATKLREIAGAMGITLPPNTDSTGQIMKTQIQNLSGAQLDSFYLAEGGIKGHQLLEQTMTQVSSNAKDASLKQLAAATLPVIRTHLTVAKDVQSSMGGRTGASGTGTSNQK